MKEWSKQNEYCSYNSWKGLSYIRHYNAIVWDEPIPPIEASIDPASLCQLNCKWCNSYSYLEPGGSLYNQMITRKYPPGHMEKLIKFLVQWGVRGFCFGGGGEPTLNNEVRNAMKIITNEQREFSLVTNGIYIPNWLLSLLPLCRWIGISIDSGTRKSYEKLKGLDQFDAVLKNIERIIAFRESYYKAGIIKPGMCDISYKFLIIPENTAEILTACRIAKALGVNEFHARPAATDRREIFGNHKIEYDLNLINFMFDECHSLEDDNFKIITSFHKFSEDFHIKNDFSRCWASALQIQCCADGNVYLCQDQRINPKYRLGSHYPDPKNILNFWGKEKHIELLKSINPKEDCPRCTYGLFNKQIEEVVVKDGMCLNFP